MSTATRAGMSSPPELATEAGRREWIVRELERERARARISRRARRTGPRSSRLSDPMDGFDAERIVARTQGREGWPREARRQLDAQRWQTAGPVPRSRQRASAAGGAVAGGRSRGREAREHGV